MFSFCQRASCLCCSFLTNSLRVACGKNMLQDSADDHAHQITRYLLFLSLSLSRGVLSFGAVVALSPCERSYFNVFSSRAWNASHVFCASAGITVSDSLQDSVARFDSLVGCLRFLSTRVLRLPPFDTMAAALKTLSPGRSYLLMNFSGHRSSTFARRRSLDPTPRLGRVSTRTADKPPGLANHRATVTNNAAPNRRHARYTPTNRPFENRIERRAQCRRSRSIHRRVALSLR